MEKNIGFAGESAQPSAPLPSAPPSYEEAVGNVSNPPRQQNIPPYPVGPSSMPAPSYSQPPSQTTMPMPSSYPGPAGPPPQTQPQYTANPNFVPAPGGVRVIQQHVTYALSSSSQKMTCPTCHANIKTTTTSDHQPLAHLCCIVLCLFGCCLCSCLPYFMSSFMNVHHFCPLCKNYIGTWKG